MDLEGYIKGYKEIEELDSDKIIKDIKIEDISDVNRYMQRLRKSNQKINEHLRFIKRTGTYNFSEDKLLNLIRIKEKIYQNTRKVICYAKKKEEIYRSLRRMHDYINAIRLVLPTDSRDDELYEKDIERNIKIYLRLRDMIIKETDRYSGTISIGNISLIRKLRKDSISLYEACIKEEIEKNLGHLNRSYCYLEGLRNKGGKDKEDMMIAEEMILKYQDRIITLKEGIR